MVELWAWSIRPGERHQSRAHGGGTRELLRVLGGAVTVEIGSEAYALEAGDAVSFHGDVPRAYANRSRVDPRFSLTVFEPRGEPGRGLAGEGSEPVSSPRGASGVPPWSMAVTAMLCVQLSNATSVPVIARVGPTGTAWLRMCFGVVFLWAIARPRFRSLCRRDVPALVGLGVVTGYMTTFFLSAVERIPLGTAVAIEFLGPLSVAGIMSKHRKALVWPLLAFAGVITLTEPWQGTIDLPGVGFALAAGTCWGLYNLLTQHVGDRFAGISGLSLTIPVAALATLPLGLTHVISGRLDWWVLPAAGVIALLTPVIAFGLEMLALRQMTHTAFGTLLSVEPAIGVLIGLIVLHQTPRPLQLVGTAIVVTAGAAAQRGGRRDTDPPSADLAPQQA